MDVIVTFLISLAADRAQRVDRRVDERASRALDAAVDQVWGLLTAKLGADPWLVRLRNDAQQGGAVSPEVRVGAEQTLRFAADGDPEFASHLRRAVFDAMNQSNEASAPEPAARNTGNYVGAVYASGGKVKIKQKVVNIARKHPVPVGAAALVLVGLLGWGGYGLVSGVSEGGTTAGSLPTTSQAPRVDDQSSPEAVGRSFVAAINARDEGSARKLVCPGYRLVDEELAAVNNDVISEHGMGVGGVTKTLIFQRVTDAGNGRKGVRLALAFSNIPETAPSQLKEAFSKPDDFGSAVILDHDGKWYLCESPR